MDTRRLKKLLKKVNKKLNHIKEHLQDQAFYLKELCIAGKNTIKYSVFFTLVGTVTVLCSLASNAMHLDYIESHVGSQVLMIKNPEGAVIRGSGTGFEVQAPSGKVYTLTNGHVCELQKDGIVLVADAPNSDRFIPRRVLEFYEKDDLCLVEALEGYSGLKLAASVDLQETVLSVGYPLREGMNIAQGMTKQYGIVTIGLEEILPNDCRGHRREPMQVEFWGIPMTICIVKQPALETNVLTYPGNSGSPLVNVYGNVVGVIFAASEMTNWGEAVPLSFVKDFLKPY